MTRAEALSAATEKLREAGVESPRREARLLLAHALGLSQERLLADPRALITNATYTVLVDRRCAREPLAWIVGHREFWSLDFDVSAATLVPRPDSETLIAAALATFPDRRTVARALDLGTGTGCLLLAALSEFPAAFGIGIDRVEEASRLARHNATRLGLGARASFLCANWAEPINGRFDLILCNPPYIPRAEITSLMPEVSIHEPLYALDGGTDGLDAYRSLLPGLAALIAPGGAAIIELGIGQEAATTDLARRAGLAISVSSDLSGIPRALTLRPAPP